MVEKCANPNCETTFKYSRSGRLFAFEVRSPSGPCKDVPRAICEKQPSHATVCFWLCQRCTRDYVVSFSIRQGIQLLARKTSDTECGLHGHKEECLQLMASSYEGAVLPGVPF